MTFLSIVGFMVTIVLGYLFPKRMGWFVISTFPIANAMFVVLIHSNFFPLNSIRFAFGITLGILFSKYPKDIPLKYLIQLPLIKMVIVFAFFITMISLDDRLLAIFSNFLPSLFLAFVLPFLIIKNERDLFKMVKIYIWQGIIISFFVLIELVSGFNPYDIFREINSQYYYVDYLYKPHYRGGFKRLVGLAGNPVFTSYLLAVYFPLALWYSLKKNISNKIPILLILTALILLMTRASFIALGVLFLFLFFYTLFEKNRSGIGITQYFKIILQISILGLLVYFLYPKVSIQLKNFFSGFFSEAAGFGVESKVRRIPIAINFFLQAPIFGNGYSPQEVYKTLMNYNDLPAPLIYLLSGGIVLSGIYLTILWVISNSTFKIIKRRKLMLYQKELLIYIGCSFIVGSVLTFSLWTERHLLVMYMLFIAVYKIYVLKLSESFK